MLIQELLVLRLCGPQSIYDAQCPFLFHSLAYYLPLSLLRCLLLVQRERHEPKITVVPFQNGQHECGRKLLAEKTLPLSACFSGHFFSFLSPIDNSRSIVSANQPSVCLYLRTLDIQFSLQGDLVEDLNMLCKTDTRSLNLRWQVFRPNRS